MNIEDIKRLPISELNNMAKDLEVPGASGMRRQDLIFAILQAQAEQNGVISGSGVLEILPDAFGFLRAVDYNYLPSPDDRSAASTCAPATLFPVRCVRPKKVKSISPS